MRSSRLASWLSISVPKPARLPAALVSLVWCCCVLGPIAGCSASKGSDNVSVAQVAVRANPDLELVATDEKQAVLTVRVKRTGRILTVKADEVVAGTAFRDLNATAATPGQPAPAAPETPPPAATVSTPARQVEASTPGARVSAAQPPGENRNPPAAAPVEPDIRAPLPGETPTARVAAARDRLRGAVATGATPVSGVPPATESTTSGASIDESRLKRRPNPVQCMGSDTVRLDGVLLRADKVAIQAMGQCALHITNSHVVGRVALEVLGNATVTIENSVIEGEVAIQAGQTSTTTARSSTIEGRVQKLQSGVVRDLGQNVWR